jgi:sec-independent protein translocase protein TatB
MEILGIGPGEFMLILVVLLVVIGPERLPALARQAGSLLVRARNWLQTSPDAALVLRARQEIEAELAALKSGLLEVQNVRDEVLGAAKQLEDSVGSIASTKLDLNSLVNPPATVSRTIAPDQSVATAAAADRLALPEGTPANSSASERSTAIEMPDRTSAALDQHAEEPHSNGIAKPAQAAVPQADLESINMRLQAIMSDLWALQEQLKQRGALDNGWQPPSWNVSLPEQTPASPAESIAPVAEAAPDVDQLAIAANYVTLDKEATAPTVEPAEGDAPDIAAKVAEAPAGNHATPAAAPAVKTRKRRTSDTAMNAAEAPAASELPTAGNHATPAAAPAVKTRKRRAPAVATTDAKQAEDTETLATEEAS